MDTAVAETLADLLSWNPSDRDEILDKLNEAGINLTELKDVKNWLRKSLGLTVNIFYTFHCRKYRDRFFQQYFLSPVLPFCTQTKDRVFFFIEDAFHSGRL